MTNVKVTSKTAAELYQAALTMPAIAMTALPEIGRVPEQLRMVTVPVPRPKPTEVAVRVIASCIHIDEIYAAQGTMLGRFFGPKHASPQYPYIMGSCVSGTVVGIGLGVSSMVVGDEVIVIPNEVGEHKSWTTYRCIPESMLIRKPPEWTHVEATANTMAACVAWGAVNQAKVSKGDKCLVIAASGGVGIMMVQYLKAAGGHVTAVCSGTNEAFVRSYGADAVIDYTQQGDYVDTTTGRSKDTFDLVLDALGGKDTERKSLEVLKNSGQFLTVVGPIRHVGEQKLSWFRVLCMIGYVCRRMFVSRIIPGGPRYLFGATMPRHAIRPAQEIAVQHGIIMPVDDEIQFGLAPIKTAVERLCNHRAKGRIVINFELLIKDKEVMPSDVHIHVDD